MQLQTVRVARATGAGNFRRDRTFCRQRFGGAGGAPTSPSFVNGEAVS